MTTTRTHSTLDLGRFQFSCPNWWAGFNRGMATQREQARAESAEWSASNWHRGKAFRITEGAEQ